MAAGVGPAGLVDVFGSSGLVRLLEPGEVLFRAGERKTHVYRVASGLICAYWQDPARGRQASGFFFGGDVVGLGGLDRHMVSAEASVESVVQCLPRGRLDAHLNQDHHLAAQHGDATQGEMALLKQALVAQGRANTLARVASLLSVLSSINAREGRADDVISDDVTCGFVADQLGLEVGVLEAALLDLKQLGLIEAQRDGRLRLCDKAALEALADGQG